MGIYEDWLKENDLEDFDLGAFESPVTASSPADVTEDEAPTDEYPDTYEGWMEKYAPKEATVAPEPVEPITEEPEGPTEYSVLGAAKEAGLQALSGLSALPRTVGMGETARNVKDFYDGIADKDPDIQEFRKASEEGRESIWTETLASTGPTAMALGMRFIPYVGAPLALSYFFHLNKDEVEESALANGADPDVAKRVAWVGGTVNTALDMAGLEAVAGKLPFVNTLLKKFKHRLVGAGVAILAAGSGEYVTEGTQTLVEKLSSEWAVSEDVASFLKKVSSREWWNAAMPDIEKSAKIGGLMGAVLGGGVTAIRPAEKPVVKPEAEPEPLSPESIRSKFASGDFTIENLGELKAIFPDDTEIVSTVDEILSKSETPVEKAIPEVTEPEKVAEIAPEEAVAAKVEQVKAPEKAVEAEVKKPIIPTKKVKEEAVVGAERVKEPLTPKPKDAMIPPEKGVDMKAEESWERGITVDRGIEITGQKTPSVFEIRNAFDKMTPDEQGAVISNIRAELASWASEKKLLLKQRKDAFVPDKPVYTTKIKDAEKLIKSKQSRLDGLLKQQIELTQPKPTAKPIQKITDRIVDIKPRLRDAQRLLAAPTKRKFGAMTYDESTQSLISKDGVDRLKYYAKGETTLDGEKIYGTDGSVIIESKFAEPRKFKPTEAAKKDIQFSTKEMKPKFKAGDKVEIRDYESGVWKSAVLMKYKPYVRRSGTTEGFDYSYSPLPVTDKETGVTPSQGGWTDVLSIRHPGEETQYATGKPSLKGVTEEQIKSLPFVKRGAVVRNDDGSFSVSYPNKRGFLIKTLDSISPESFSMNASYGRVKLKPGEQIAGAYTHKSKTVHITKYGDKWTVGHEFMHFLEHSGLLTNSEIDSLERQSVTFNEGKYKGQEGRARWVTHELKAREKKRNSPIGRIVQKIADILDGFVNLFTQTTRGAVRAVESGKAVTRKQKGLAPLATTVPAYQTTAYTGSPAAYEKASTDYIGTGEGAAAFGWGLYFTDKEAIGRHYAKSTALSGNYPIINGKKMAGIGWYDRFKSEYGDKFKKIEIHTAFAFMRDANTVEGLDKVISATEGNIKKILTMTKGKKVSYPKTKNLYKVTLHKGKEPGEYTWLDWYEDIPDSKIKQVQSQLRNENRGAIADYIEPAQNISKQRGKGLYDTLVSHFKKRGAMEAKKEASLFLLRAGIDGIRYPTESLSGGIRSRAKEKEEVLKKFTNDATDRLFEGRKTPLGKDVDEVTEMVKAFIDGKVETVELSDLVYDKGGSLPHWVSDQYKEMYEELLKPLPQNYVVFDAEAVTIDEHIQFSTVQDLTPEQKAFLERHYPGKAKEFTEKGTVDLSKRPKTPSLIEKWKDDWFREKDWAELQHSVEAAQIQRKISRALGYKKNLLFILGPKKRLKQVEDVTDMDAAIHIYLDLKRNPGHREEFLSDLTPEQQRIVDLTDTIDSNPELKEVANYIRAEYDKIGDMAFEEGLIFNILDNYVGRAWRLSKGGSTEAFRKFGTKTRHRKHRVFETILEGQAQGFELLVKGASNNLELLKTEISRTTEDRKLMKTGEKMKWMDSEDNVIENKKLKGYEEIQHPNFTHWARAAKVDLKETEVDKITGLRVGDAVRLEGKIGKVDEISGTDVSVKFIKDKIEDIKTVNFKSLKKVQPRGVNFIIADDGTVFEKRSLYAPEEVAKSLNKILGTSKLKGKAGIDTLTKYNAVFKHWILVSSFFHHLAFMRSYLLGTKGKTLKEWNINTARKAGLKAIDELTPETELLTRNGLTIGKVQDWEENILSQEDSIFGTTLDKITGSTKIKDKLETLRQMQAKFLFGNFGAGLKMQAALIELRNFKKSQEKLAAKGKPAVLDENEQAKIVANLINDDFGGLHLGRMERDPTIQHIFRLFSLAPDWTESNVRSMVKALRIGGDAETKFYRKFWASIITKGVTATVLANILLSIGDDEDQIEKFKKAWKAGNFKWLGIDITPIYKLFGGKTEAKKYFSVFGHFQDPMKFLSHPIRSAHHKGSVMYRLFHEAMAGTDWRGHRFTTFSELFKFDDKGFYLTTTKTHKVGEKKGEKLGGKTTVYDIGKRGPLEISQILSYTLAQIKGIQPIQIQNFIGFLQGEIEGFDAINRSLGIHTSSTYPSRKKALKEFTDAYIKLRQQGKPATELWSSVNLYNKRQRDKGKKEDVISISSIRKSGSKRIRAERIGRGGTSAPITRKRSMTLREALGK